MTLKRGVTGSADLAGWRALVEGGDVGAARRNVTFTMFDAALTPVAVWVGEACWPASLIASYGASDTPPAVEELVVACNTIGRVPQ